MHLTRSSGLILDVKVQRSNHKFIAEINVASYLTLPVCLAVAAIGYFVGPQIEIDSTELFFPILGGFGVVVTGIGLLLTAGLMFKEVNTKMLPPIFTLQEVREVLSTSLPTEVILEQYTIPTMLENPLLMLQDGDYGSVIWDERSLRKVRLEDFRVTCLGLAEFDGEVESELKKRIAKFGSVAMHWEESFRAVDEGTSKRLCDAAAQLLTSIPSYSRVAIMARFDNGHYQALPSEILVVSSPLVRTLITNPIVAMALSAAPVAGVIYALWRGKAATAWYPGDTKPSQGQLEEGLNADSGPGCSVVASIDLVIEPKGNGNRGSDPNSVALQAGAGVQVPLFMREEARMEAGTERELYIRGELQEAKTRLEKSGGRTDVTLKDVSSTPPAAQAAPRQSYASSAARSSSEPMVDMSGLGGAAEFEPNRVTMFVPRVLTVEEVLSILNTNKAAGTTVDVQEHGGGHTVAIRGADGSAVTLGLRGGGMSPQEKLGVLGSLNAVPELGLASHRGLIEDSAMMIGMIPTVPFAPFSDFNLCHRASEDATSLVCRLAEDVKAVWYGVPTAIYSATGTLLAGQGIAAPPGGNLPALTIASEPLAACNDSGAIARRRASLLAITHHQMCEAEAVPVSKYLPLLPMKAHCRSHEDTVRTWMYLLARSMPVEMPSHMYSAVLEALKRYGVTKRLSKAEKKALEKRDAKPWWLEGANALMYATSVGGADISSIDCQVSIGDIHGFSFEAFLGCKTLEDFIAAVGGAPLRPKEELMQALDFAYCTLNGAREVVTAQGSTDPADIQVIGIAEERVRALNWLLFNTDAEKHAGYEDVDVSS